MRLVGSSGHISGRGIDSSLPQMEFMGLPAANVYASKCLMKCNYQQALEGSIDTAHLTFLHRSIGPMEKDVFGVGELQEFGDADGAPRFFCEDTEYGMRISARREGSPDATIGASRSG